MFNRMQRDQITVIVFFFNFSDHLINVNAYICEVRPEREHTKKCKLKWILESPTPCDCTSVVMGGFNTRIPERLCAPVAVDNPLVSDDINSIRKHYGLQCYEQSKLSHAGYNMVWVFIVLVDEDMME